MKLADDAIIHIERAELVEGYKIKISFSDATQQIVDFGSFLTKSQNPLIRAYLDPKRFRQFSVQDGDLLWGDYELCFPVADLYEANI